MKLKLFQMHIDRDVVKNRDKMLSVLASAAPKEWVIFPEGALSGYFPEDAHFLKELDQKLLVESIEQIRQEVKRRNCYCLFGTAFFKDNVWYNAVALQTGSGEQHFYHKTMLSSLDKNHFAPGTMELSTYFIDGVRVGIQVCREVLFSQSWLALKEQQAQIVFHINNAIKPHDQVWEHVLIARGVEDRFFVCSVNNAAPPQKLTSYLVSPFGQLLIRAQEQTEQVLVGEIDLNEVGQSIY